LTPEESHKKSMRTIWIITFIFALLGIAGFLYWLFVWRFEESTSDAYVHGNQVVVTSQIPGYITSITVNDTEFVEEGRVLIELDRIDRKMAFDIAKSSLADTVRQVTQLFENVGALKGELESSKANFSMKAQNYKHRKALVESGGVSKEEFQHAEAFFVEAFANMLTVQHNLRGAEALVANTTIETHPLVEKAMDDVREAFVNLSRCTIRSPVSGIVAMKKAQVGESIALETPLMMIVPLEQIWVDANFKEVQLKKVRLGQPVSLKSDIYGGDMIYQGEVIGIAAATGSVMSVLPPQNATGNWIKIVQRLPVRVRLKPEQLKDYPLRLGLSMDVTVDIHNTSGKMIPETRGPGAQYSTGVFEQQEEGAEVVIQKILKENSNFGKSDSSKPVG